MSWQQDLRQNLVKSEDLLPYLKMDDEERRQLDGVLRRFPMSVTPYYLSLIDFDDESDPIRKMAIPSAGEQNLSGSFDTSGETGNTVAPGLQHKYRETVLLLSTSACATYCRHCFRKRLVGTSDDEVARNLGAVRAYILGHPEISNVLVSGGDALLNDNSRLRSILVMLQDIPHLDFVRLGSRAPVVFPQRITQDAELQEMFAEVGRYKQLVLVTQFNHPREITPQSTAAVAALRALGMQVRNQTVLLRGVNDKPAVLAQLLRRLTAIGVQPYYVFQCRPVSGVKNRFQVPLRTGLRIVKEAKNAQNGIGKTFRYCLSNVSGKMEILGIKNEREMYFMYQEAKDASRLGEVFSLPVAHSQAWLD